MKFKFRLEKVLDHKKVERDVAYRDFAEARRIYDEGRAKLDQMYEEISQARAFEVQTVQQGGRGGESLKWSSFFIEGQNHKIELQKKINRQLIQEVERRQEVLVEKARDLKTFEKLKDKMRERFKKEERKKDMKSIVEMVTMAFQSPDGTE